MLVVGQGVLEACPALHCVCNDADRNVLHCHVARLYRSQPFLGTKWKSASSTAPRAQLGSSCEAVGSSLGELGLSPDGSSNGSSDGSSDVSVAGSAQCIRCSAPIVDFSAERSLP